MDTVANAPPQQIAVRTTCWHCHQEGIELLPMRAGYFQRCPRCEVRLDPWMHRIRDNAWSFVFAAGALLFYPLAMLLPMMSIEQLGHRHESNLIEAVTSLLSHGQLVVGIVVLACSVLLPISKVLGMFVLAVPSFRKKLSQHRRAQLFHVIEFTGRFGFLDIVLIAILVAMLKIGDLVSVEVGPGLIAFTACVFCSLISSFLFNPKTIWED